MEILSQVESLTLSTRELPGLNKSMQVGVTGHAGRSLLATRTGLGAVAVTDATLEEWGWKHRAALEEPAQER